MKKSLLTLSLIMLTMLSWVPSSQADIYFNNGHKLVVLLEAYEKSSYITDDDNFRRGKCLGYITGIWDASNHMYAGYAGLKANYLIDIVSRYVQAHPHLLNQPAFDLVHNAFRQAFPK